MRVIEPDQKMHTYLRERYSEYLEINRKLAAAF